MFQLLICKFTDTLKNQSGAFGMDEASVKINYEGNVRFEVNRSHGRYGHKRHST